MNAFLTTLGRAFWLGAALLTTLSGLRAESSVMPDFELGRWDSNAKAKLADFAGEIVVLDFFAYWCVPCRNATAEIEGGIQKYYAARKGNPNGVPVRVVAINLEKDNPKLTEKFIQNTGAEFVLNDFEGALLEKLGGAGTPFLVVIDGTHATKEKPDFRILYKSEGFEGTKKLRSVIDSIKRPPKPTAKLHRDPVAVIEEATGPPVAYQGEIAFDAMLTSDMTITSTALTCGQKRGGTEWRIGYTHNTVGLDYAPYVLFDFLGFPARVTEEYDAGSVLVRQKIGGALTAGIAGGGYRGFTDYRSVWLANYYFQQFNFLPGYELPDPNGYNVSSSLRWEYQPTTGFVEASFLYSHEVIAPGYEYEPLIPALLKGRGRLDTYAPTLKLENVLTRRIRLLNELQLTFTTGREPRYSYRGSLNLALGERWVWRTTGGYAFEDPTLRAGYAGATLEFEITPRWLINASGLYYHDTGEIENSAFISTAAPGQRIWQAGLGMRYVGDISTFSLSVAPVIADYEPLAVGTRPFTNLYQDRDWISVQAAFSLVF